jgi:hypothetical protein
VYSTPTSWSMTCSSHGLSRPPARGLHAQSKLIGGAQGGGAALSCAVSSTAMPRATEL